MSRAHQRLSAALARALRCRPDLMVLERRSLLAVLNVPGTYPTIAQAVAAASPSGGDTVLVADGTYSVEHVVINKPLTLLSQNGAGSTFLTGNGTVTAEEGSIEVQNTTGTVTIGGVNQGFTFQDPVVRGYDSYISSLYITGNTAPVIVQYNTFVGLNGVGDPFDVGMNAYQTQTGGTLFIQNNDFSKMFQGMLIEVARGGATIQSNRFHDLVAQQFGSSTYEPEGIFALTYGGASGDVNGMTIASNDFRDFNGLAITVSGGYSGLPAAKFTNVAITNNAITSIGFAPSQFRAGIVIQNGADTAGDAPNGGVRNSVISGNTIAAGVPCVSGSRGIWVLGQNNNLSIQNNFIRDLDRGISIIEQVPGAGFASGMTVSQNSFTGNTQAIQNDSPNPVNAAQNFWGTNTPPYVKAQANGGVNVGYNPWLGDGTDTDLATPGFQPNLTNLYTDQLSISGVDSVVKNTTYSLTLNNSNYPNSPKGLPLTSWLINWGDGSVPTPESFPGTSTVVAHTYTTAGNYNVTATATDSGGNTYTVALATDPAGNLYNVPGPNGNLYPAPNAVPVNVTNYSTLLVTHFYQNPSGFSVRFNQPIDDDVLHLYTSTLPQFANTVGPPDVTLVGALTGPVGGTLVIDPDLMGFTFVKTSSGGAADNSPLANDTYTVTLVSDPTTGIRTSVGGSPLDGNNDGTPGGNYVTNFSVTNAPRQVSVSDFVRGPGQPVVVPAATGTGLPVQINNASGVLTVMLYIHYDATRLQLNTSIPVVLDPSMPAGTQISTNVTVPGLLEICLRSPTPLGPGAQNLLRINATVPASAAGLYTSKEVLTVDQVSLLDGGGNPIAATGDNAAHILGYLGDTSGNGVINSFDSTLLQRFILSLDTGFGAFKNADPLLIGDISANGVVNSFDRTLIQQYILGQNPPQIPAVPNIVVSQSGPDPRVSLPSDLTVRSGGSISVPVDFLLTAAEAVGLQSFDLAIAYDPSAFKVNGVSGGGMATGFEFTWTTGVTPGLLIISASRVPGPTTVQPGASGTLARIDLAALPGAQPGKYALTLVSSVYATGGPRATMMNDGGLTLELVNGAVTIQGKATGRGAAGMLAPLPTAVDEAIDLSWSERAEGSLVRPLDTVVPAQTGVIFPPPGPDASVAAGPRVSIRYNVPNRPGRIFDKNRSLSN